MHANNTHKLVTKVMIALCLIGIVACCDQENAEAVVAWCAAFAMSLALHGELTISTDMMEDRDYWRDKFMQAMFRYAACCPKDRESDDGTAKDSEK